MKNILIVDDNAELLAILSERLGDYLPDCRIVTAPDGARGEDLLEKMAVDLIITDLAMPVMDGYVFIARTKVRHPSIPVCVMSAEISPRGMMRLNLLGIDCVLEKPFPLEEIVRAIRARVPCTGASRRRIVDN